MFASTVRWALALMTLGVVDCAHRAPHQVGPRSSEERRADSKQQDKDAIRLQWDCVFEILESRPEMPESRLVSKLTLLKLDSKNYRLHATWAGNQERTFFRRADTLIEIWPDLRKYREIPAGNWEELLVRLKSLGLEFAFVPLTVAPSTIGEEMLEEIRQFGGNVEIRRVDGWPEPVLGLVRAIAEDESGAVAFSLSLQEADLIDSDQIAPRLKGYEKVTKIPSYAPWWK